MGTGAQYGPVDRILLDYHVPEERELNLAWMDTLQRGHAETAALLLERTDAVVDPGMVRKAIESGSLPLLTVLLDHGADDSYMHGYNDEGWGVLSLAIHVKDLEMARVLLQRGVDIDSPNKDCSTALHWAVNESNIPATKFLLDRGARVSATNEDGKTPLRFAISNLFEVT